MIARVLSFRHALDRAGNCEAGVGAVGLCRQGTRSRWKEPVCVSHGAGTGTCGCDPGRAFLPSCCASLVPCVGGQWVPEPPEADHAVDIHGHLSPSADCFRASERFLTPEMALSQEPGSFPFLHGNPHL